LAEAPYIREIIDTWSPEKAQAYAEQGYVHYHELVRVEDASLHPDKVIWSKYLPGNGVAPVPPFC
jgi:hypothetical protein